MEGKDTLPEILRPLMAAPSARTPYCAVCGRPAPLEQHHIVRRSAGEMHRDGRPMPKPTVTLCGFGNNLSDADGHPYCHGLAHANRLHFRWVPSRIMADEWNATVPGGHLECIVLDEPAPYAEALGMKGWRRLRNVRWRA